MHRPEYEKLIFFIFMLTLLAMVGLFFWGIFAIGSTIYMNGEIH